MATHKLSWQPLQHQCHPSPHNTPRAPDLGENVNLITDYAGADAVLKDQDTGTCIDMETFTIDFSGVANCTGGVCRVNYLLVYLESVSLDDTTVTSITVTGPDGLDKTIAVADLELTGENITISDNLLLDTLTITFDGEQSVCEIVVAGTEIGQYDCTAGYYLDMDKKQCLACGPGKYSSAAGSESCDLCPENTYSEEDSNSACTACDYVSYSVAGSTTCVPCTKDRALDNLRCYENLGYNDNLQTTYSNIASYDPADDSTEVLSSPVDIALTGAMHLSSVVIISEDPLALATKISITDCDVSDKDYGASVLVAICKNYAAASSVSIEVTGSITINKLFVFGIAFGEAEAPPGYKNTGSAFVICGKGMFSKGGSAATECSECLENQYQSQEGATSCENCQSDFYSAPGAEECTECQSRLDSVTACADLDNSCPEVSETNVVYGNYSYDWPLALMDTVVSLPCQYNIGSSATKSCASTEDEVKYETTDFSACNTKVTDELNDISEIDVVADNLVEISTSIKDITESSSGVMNADNVEKTSQIIDKLIELEGDLGQEVQSNIIKTVNSIHQGTEADQIAQGAAAANMRESVKKFTNKVSGADGYIKESSVAVAVKTYDSNKARASFSIVGSSADFTDTELVDEEDSAAVFSASVPTDKFGRDLTAVFYDTAKFYPDNTSVQDVGSTMREQFLSGSTKDVVKKVISMVSEISYANNDDSVTFDDGQKLELNYAVEKEVPSLYYKMAVSSSYQCVFYDTETGDWADSGCTTTTVVGEDGKSNVICECDHMTSFAVLMSFSSDYDPVEDYISQILLAMSLGCLLCTLVAYLPAKDLLKTRTVRLNLLLVTSLILAIITFMSMELAVKSSVTTGSAPTDEDLAPIPCVVVAFFMNYFWLCQMAWMVCEAIVMYRALVSCVVNSHIHRYMLKFNLACWGIPLIFPIIGVIWGQTDFANPKTCFLKTPYGFVTFYAPVLASVVFNIFIFIRIAWSISRNANSMGTKVPVSELERRKKQFKFAVTVMSLLGVSWVFGFLLIFEETNMIWLRYLFILSNSTQGIFIFILYVVLNDNLKKVWLKLLGMVDPDKPSHSSVPYSRSKGKTNETAFAPSAGNSKPGSPRSPKVGTTFVTENRGTSTASAPRFHKLQTSRSVSPSGPASNTYSHIYDNAWSEDSLDTPRQSLEDSRSGPVPFRNRALQVMPATKI